MKETYVGQELIRLMHSFGNLHVHISGEGKVDFLQKEGPSWLGMIKFIISGDIGCMKPFKGYDVSALDQAIDYLLNLDQAPHSNLSTNEEFVPDVESWKKFVMDIKESTEFTGNPKPIYKFSMLGGKDGKTVITTVTIEPLANQDVVGEFGAVQKNTFLGMIEDYDQPKIDSCFIKAEGTEYEIQLDKIITFRNKRIPQRGDYLLKDEETEMYIVIPGEDYSIH